MCKITFISIKIRSQGAEALPPLGTVLGNIGLNSTKFCKDFNDFTSELPSYFKLIVLIRITENKNYSFTVKKPSIGDIVPLLKKEESVINKDGTVTNREYVDVIELLYLVKYLYGEKISLEKGFQIVMGFIKSTTLFVKCD